MEQQRRAVDPQGEKIRQTAAEVINGLQRLYFDTVKPLEEQFLFHDFNSTALSLGDFAAKPTVLLIGQYSTGKTSFINYMIGRDFPGQRIGPEPTTDRFMAIQYGDKERCIPGNAAAAQSDKQWTGLQSFGVEFLNRFECSEMPSPLLQEMTFVDSPGILSGEKQRLQRGYDFVKVCKWFAERADKILLLFDAHKLDISDEFKRTIEGISFAHNKISVVLNKADMISQQELMRVYGALMWSLGKIVKTPEVSRVYVSSFWDKCKQEHSFKPLFDVERQDLLKDLRLLPKSCTMNKINEMVKRCRLLKVHVCILSHLKDQMPAMFGRKKKAQELVDNLDQVFVEVQRKHQLAIGDFPNIEQFKKVLIGYDIGKFKKCNYSRMSWLDRVITEDLPKLVTRLSEDDIGKELNPFSEEDTGGVVAESDDSWLVTDSAKQKAAEAFSTTPLNDEGRVGGGAVKGILEQTELPTSLLRKVWDLSSIDGKGSLDQDELTVAIHLAEAAKEGRELPKTLPFSMVPPSKRGRFASRVDGGM